MKTIRNGVVALALMAGAWLHGYHSHQPATKAGAFKSHTEPTYAGQTTLSYATRYQGVIYLASLNGITPPGNPINDNGIGDPNDTPSFTFLQVDTEVMQVLQLNAPSKSVLVNRGYLATAALPHNAGAVVYYGPPQDWPAWGELREWWRTGSAEPRWSANVDGAPDAPDLCIQCAKRLSIDGVRDTRIPGVKPIQ
jgi:hypothetical protein